MAAGSGTNSLTDLAGTVIGGGSGGHGGSNRSRLSKAIKALASGDYAAAADLLGDVNVQKSLLSFDYNNNDLKKVGLSKDDIDEAGFLGFKRFIKDRYRDDKGLSTKDLKQVGTKLTGLVKSADKQKINDKLAKLGQQAGDLVPGVTPLNGTRSPFMGGLAQFAAQSVRSARGVRAAIATSAMGDKAFGKSLTRPTILSGTIA